MCEMAYDDSRGGGGSNRALRHLRRLRRRLAGGGPGWWWVVKGGRPGTGTHWVSRARTRRHAHNENGPTRGKRSRSTMGMGSAHRRAAAPPARPRLCSPHSLCLSTLCGNGMEQWAMGQRVGRRVAKWVGVPTSLIHALSHYAPPIAKPRTSSSHYAPLVVALSTPRRVHYPPLIVCTVHPLTKCAHHIVQARWT